MIRQELVKKIATAPKSNNDFLILIHHDDYLTIRASETVAQTSQSRQLSY